MTTKMPARTVISRVLLVATGVLWLSVNVGSLSAQTFQRDQPPHPAVARISVQENGSISQGSGTLIANTATYGLVITNWHVVRDATGQILVQFPDGFQSAARVLKADQYWDLAALLIWRPTAQPVALARQAPRPGDVLTIAGYGPGHFRAATGRCTQYVAPGFNLPYEMVEVSAEARQGDSGGPILNSQGELAGVLFGSGSGSTSGSYCGRVGWFLSDVWNHLPPQSGQPESSADTGIARAETPASPGHSYPIARTGRPLPATDNQAFPSYHRSPQDATPPTQPPTGNVAATAPDKIAGAPRFVASTPATGSFDPPSSSVEEPSAAAPPTRGWFEHARNLFALIGVTFVILKLSGWLGKSPESD